MKEYFKIGKLNMRDQHQLIPLHLNIIMPMK